MSPNQTRTRISGIKTFGVPVVDQERSLSFYVGKLGLELRLDTVYGHERWVEVAPQGSATTIALVRGPDQVRVGIDAVIQLTTQDIEAARSDLVARGVNVVEGIRRSPRVMFTIYDPDRNRIEIIQE